MTVSPNARKWLVYSVLMAALSSILMGLVSIQYSNYAIRKSQQQWCKIVSTLNEANKETPPTSPAGKRLAAEFARLNDQFKCRK